MFSADNHISLAADIFYERFPENLKDEAPRIWYEDGAYMVGLKGQSFVVGDFSAVLMQYDDLAGASTNDIQAPGPRARRGRRRQRTGVPERDAGVVRIP